MRYLLNTGILLRLVNRESAQHEVVRHAVRRLKQDQHECVCALQNLCEFWNVCTRPETARGGLGLTFDETLRRLRTIERTATLLPELPQVAGRWKQLVLGYQIRGVQVHDTRLVATMQVHAISHLLTLNPADFHRFTEIGVSTPAELLAR